MLYIFSAFRYNYTDKDKERVYMCTVLYYIRGLFYWQRWGVAKGKEIAPMEKIWDIITQTCSTEVSTAVAKPHELMHELHPLENYGIWLLARNLSLNTLELLKYIPVPSMVFAPVSLGDCAGLAMNHVLPQLGLWDKMSSLSAYKHR